MAAGTPISETIELRRIDRAVAASLVIDTISADKRYTACVRGDHAYQFSRVYRPKWATVAGWVFTVGLFGAGFWLFFIKRTETCTVAVSEARAIVQVTLTGGLLPDVHDQLLQVLEHAEGAGSALGGAEMVLPARSLPTRIALPEERAAGDIELTERETHSDPFTPPSLEVHFGTGERIRVRGTVFVGRDPIRIDDTSRIVETLALADPTGTVSKTHFAIGAGQAGLWVEDLHSTNGTAVGTHVETARRLTPGDRVAVTVGQTIFFGDLSADVRAGDDDRVVGSLPPSGPTSRA
jgi:hypothetical protein